MSQLRLHNLQVQQRPPINLEIAAGQCITIAGPSGCGKTQLLRAIADLDPHQGEVQLNGMAQEAIPAPQWRCQVGYLPAESAWWREQVGDHFTDPDPKLFESLGFTLAWLEREVSRLSTGERQRLALLRLLNNKPKVLLLDEPTANLDQTNAQQVEQLIHNYRQIEQAAVIWVTHDQSQHHSSTAHYCFKGNKLEQITWN